MTGFPPITDSDGGMGFGPELFLEEFLFFLLFTIDSVIYCDCLF